MDIKKRIANIKDYFTFFNVTLEASYSLVSFPDDWLVPDDIYDGRVKTTSDNKGYYFFAEPSEDPDIIFDAIDDIIKYNKNLEQKKQLLIKKMNELKELFENEELDKLSSMEFSFKGGIKKMPKFDKKRNVEVVEQKNEEEITDNTQETEVENNVETSSMMEEAKKIVEG